VNTNYWYADIQTFGFILFTLSSYLYKRMLMFYKLIAGSVKQGLFALLFNQSVQLFLGTL
jgi:hypothetical protein